jgi:hypothetical protein
VIEQWTFVPLGTSSGIDGPARRGTQLRANIVIGRLRKKSTRAVKLSPKQSRGKRIEGTAFQSFLLQNRNNESLLPFQIEVTILSYTILSLTHKNMATHFMQL